jgi:hypothetical protein
MLTEPNTTQEPVTEHHLCRRASRGAIVLRTGPSCFARGRDASSEATTLYARLYALRKAVALAVPCDDREDMERCFACGLSMTEGRSVYRALRQQRMKALAAAHEASWGV